MDPVILTRVVTPLAGLGILFFVTDLGFGVAHVKRVSEGLDEGDCFTTFLVFKVVTTGFFIVASLAFFWVRVVALDRPFEDIALTAYILLVGYYATQSLRTAFVSTFDARKEAARTELTKLVETLVRTGLTVGVAVVYAAVAHNVGPLAGVVTADAPVFRLVAHYPSGALAFTYLAGMSISVAAAFWQWRQSGVRLGRFRWDILRGYWEFALPLFLLSVVGTLSGYIDRLALGYFGSGPDAGLFDLPKRFTTLLEAIPYAVASLLFPTVSAMHARNDLEGVKDTTERALRYISMIVLPVTAFTVMFSPQLISIFIGDRWQSAALALSLLAAYTFIIGMMRPYYSLIAGLGRSDLTAKVGITVTVTNIVLNLVLIPRDIKSLGIPLAGLGVTGAALATLLSGVLGFAVLRVMGRDLPVQAHARGFWRQLVAALLMLAALGALHFTGVHPLVRWYDFLLYTGLGGVVYLAGLVLVREFTREDFGFFMGLASVPEMLRYLRSELFHRRSP